MNDIELVLDIAKKKKMMNVFEVYDDEPRSLSLTIVLDVLDGQKFYDLLDEKL